MGPSIGPFKQDAERSLCLLCTCQHAAVATWKNAVKGNGETVPVIVKEDDVDDG